MLVSWLPQPDPSAGPGRGPPVQEKRYCREGDSCCCHQDGGEGRGDWGQEHPTGPQDPGWGLAPLCRPAGTKRSQGQFSPDSLPPSTSPGRGNNLTTAPKASFSSSLASEGMMPLFQPQGHPLSIPVLVPVPWGMHRVPHPLYGAGLTEQEAPQVLGRSPREQVSPGSSSGHQQVGGHQAAHVQGVAKRLGRETGEKRGEQAGEDRDRMGGSVTTSRSGAGQGTPAPGFGL